MNTRNVEYLYGEGNIKYEEYLYSEVCWNKLCKYGIKCDLKGCDCTCHVICNLGSIVK